MLKGELIQIKEKHVRKNLFTGQFFFLHNFYHWVCFFVKMWVVFAFWRNNVFFFVLTLYFIKILIFVNFLFFVKKRRISKLYIRWNWIFEYLFTLVLVARNMLREISLCHTHRTTAFRSIFFVFSTVLAYQLIACGLACVQCDLGGFFCLKLLLHATHLVFFRATWWIQIAVWMVFCLYMCVCG